MNFAIALTTAGPVLGGLSWMLGWTWLFWAGVVACAITLALDMGSGAMKMPILPAACMILGAGFWSPWWIGVAAGLVTWTAVEAAGMLINRVRLGRQRSDP